MHLGPKIFSVHQALLSVLGMQGCEQGYKSGGAFNTENVLIILKMLKMFFATSSTSLKICYHPHPPIVF